MNQTIEILFIVGVFVNLIKGADLILRPHQSAWIQDRFDSFALWLDFTRPLDWYAKRHGAKKIFLILLSLTVAVFFSIFYISERQLIYLIFPIAFLFPLVWAIRLIRNKERFQAWEESQSDRPRTDAIPIKSLNQLHYRLNAPLQNWLFRSSTAGDYLVRPLVVFIVGAFWIALWPSYVLGMFTLMDLMRPLMPLHGWKMLMWFLPLGSLLAIGMILITIFMVEPAVTGIVCLVLCGTTVLMLLTEGILKVVRGTVWRIAEYNKGAFAAIALIVTVALGLAELYLRFRH
jgi:hypothetical protein